jgi:hypothetical protein
MELLFSSHHNSPDLGIDKNSIMFSHSNKRGPAKQGACETKGSALTGSANFIIKVFVIDGPSNDGKNDSLSFT